DAPDGDAPDGEGVDADAEGADPDPVETPAPAPAPAPVPDPAPQPRPAPVPKTRPDPAPAPTPRPATVAPAASGLPVTFRSVPWGARVKVDGVDLGPTPVMGHPLTEGSHTVELVLGSDRIEKVIRVGARHPNSYRWAVAEGFEGWQASFSK
ncbi:MAG: PEGA domain-containing protein, partial [Acidimicrobiia bacterium]